MKSTPSNPPQARQTLLSLLTIAGGVPLAVIPAATLAISAHVLPVGSQGAVALASTVATFSAQIASGLLVESRLSSAAPGEKERHVAFPRWLAALALLAAAAVIAVPIEPVVILALPVLVSALEIGRAVSVAERMEAREIWSAVLVGAGALGGVGVALLEAPWAFAPLAIGIAAATLIRTVRVPRTTTPAEPAVRAWITADVALTGFLYPALNSVILASLGSLPAAQFATLSTVSGLLAIPINFMRIRLLKEHSMRDILISSGALLAAIISLVVLDAIGIFGLVFGESWPDGAIAPLGVACLWRGASILSTLPFAALRRAGRVRVLTVLRGAAALATFAGAASVVSTQSITLVFVVFVAGEFLQALLYEAARRHTAAPPMPLDNR